MIKAVGNDIIEVARIKRAWERHGDRFLNKLFTAREIAYCLSKKACPERHLAGRFAAKEALVKALGTGFGPVSWLELEIINDSMGKPHVTVAERIALTYHNPRFLLSISHCHEYATAVAILL